MKTIDPPTPEVLEIGKLNFSGNIIPDCWYQEITLPSGKPYLNAIVILAEIVYWYRPVEIRDEATGFVIGLKKKFKGDKLQRNYQAIADKFGLSKRQVTDACHFLHDRRLIDLDFRTVKIGEVTASNVLFIGINASEVERITFSCLASVTPITFERDSPTSQTGELPHPNVTAPPVDRETNTKISTKTSTKNSTEKEKDPSFSPQEGHTIAEPLDRPEPDSESSTPIPSSDQNPGSVPPAMGEDRSSGAACETAPSNSTQRFDQEFRSRAERVGNAAFSEWLKGYQHFCHVVDAAPGTVEDAWQAWLVVTEGKDPPPELLDGTYLFIQQKGEQFLKEGKAIGVPGAPNFLIKRYWEIAIERSRVKAQAPNLDKAQLQQLKAKQAADETLERLRQRYPDRF